LRKNNRKEEEEEENKNGEDYVEAPHSASRRRRIV